MFTRPTWPHGQAISSSILHQKIAPADTGAEVVHAVRSVACAHTRIKDTRSARVALLAAHALAPAGRAVPEPRRRATGRKRQEGGVAIRRCAMV